MSIEQFPMTSIKAVMTDDEREFHSDMVYLHDLLVAIGDSAYTAGYANPIPITMSDELDALITAVRGWGR